MFLTVIEVLKRGECVCVCICVLVWIHSISPLVLHSEIPRMGLRRPHEVSGLEPWLVTCKASILPSVLLLQPSGATPHSSSTLHVKDLEYGIAPTYESEGEGDFFKYCHVGAEALLGKAPPRTWPTQSPQAASGNSHQEGPKRV